MFLASTDSRWDHPGYVQMRTRSDACVVFLTPVVCSGTWTRQARCRIFILVLRISACASLRRLFSVCSLWHCWESCSLPRRSLSNRRSNLRECYCTIGSVIVPIITACTCVDSLFSSQSVLKVGETGRASVSSSLKKSIKESVRVLTSTQCFDGDLLSSNWSARVVGIFNCDFVILSVKELKQQVLADKSRGGTLGLTWGETVSASIFSI